MKYIRAEINKIETEKQRKSKQKSMKMDKISSKTDKKKDRNF